MDPITTAIVGALGKTAVTAVGDAYKGLKSLLTKKLGQSSEVVKAVEELEKKPESEGKKAVLNEELQDANVDQDKEIVTAVNELIKKVNEQPGSQTLNYVQQNISGDHNFVTGTGDINIQKS